jgi:hypothetical protein
MRFCRRRRSIPYPRISADEIDAVLLRSRVIAQRRAFSEIERLIERLFAPFVDLVRMDAVRSRYN